MTTDNALDLTDHKAAAMLAALLAAGMPFKVYMLAPEGYLVLAFTARQERQKGRNAVRWHGYKRIGGKLRKVYLGTSERVTLATVEGAIARLAQME
jgi:hypothetical protein